MQPETELDALIRAELDRALERVACKSYRVAWSDKGFPLLREAFARTEASLTPEQREERVTAMAAMVAKNWDSFAATMIRPVWPNVDGAV